MQYAPIIGISRHRILRDGQGVTTLVGFKGCMLQCAYCINKELLMPDSPYRMLTPAQLMDIVKIDDIYFRSTNGGITFGGGEPLFHSSFIAEFKRLCHPQWKINIETSLNVNRPIVYDILGFADSLIVDVKTLNKDIYQRYTGKGNNLLFANLKYISELHLQQKIEVRLPLIPGYNDREDVDKSMTILKAMGFSNLNIIQYLEDRESTIYGRRNRQATKYGKYVCNILKHIRKIVADANGISIHEDICPMTVCKSGTCTKCERMLSFISSELNKLSEQII